MRSKGGKERNFFFWLEFFPTKNPRQRRLVAISGGYVGRKSTAEDNIDYII